MQECWDCYSYLHTATLLPTFALRVPLDKLFGCGANSQIWPHLEPEVSGAAVANREPLASCPGEGGGAGAPGETSTSFLS